VIHEDSPLTGGDTAERLVELLRRSGATFRTVEHEAVTTSEEAARVRGTPLQQGAKALVCRAGGTHVLLVLPANRRMDSRAFKRAYGVKDVAMISAQELKDLTGLEVGAVPPFGSLIGLPTYVDERLLDEPNISFNAGRRTFSVVLATEDYQRIENPIVGRFASDA
jgi:Ala-tRNA(Pro) deacylase